MNNFLGEFLGTTTMITLGCGLGAGINLKKTFNSQQPDWFYIAFSWGIAVTMGIYVAGSIGSLGHLNPAVTISLAVNGSFPWSKVFSYLLGQYLGALLGALIVAIHFWPYFKVSKNSDTIGIFANVSQIKSPFFNFISEFFATFFFMLILNNLGNFTSGLKPLMVGLVIFVIGAGLGTTTGFSLNPARDLGPRLIYTIVPIPYKGSAEWWFAWVPFIGPICGAIFASELQLLIK